MDDQSVVLSARAAAVEEYADHQSWRCAHPERFPWEPDCPCGLTGALRSAQLPGDWASLPGAVARAR
jgi:hypothetical protein